MSANPLNTNEFDPSVAGTAGSNNHYGSNGNAGNTTSKTGGGTAGSNEPQTSKTHYKQSTIENLKDRFDSWTVIKYIAIAFPFLLLYIYNSLHTAKAIKKKDELSKLLKELHSERISLESEITRASKQTQIAEKLKSTGLKEITSPPIKLTRERKD